jgi:hypothetical protein
MIPFKRLRLIQFIKKEYHLFNLLVFSAVLLMCVYLKTVFFSLNCPYAEIGIKCKTCGLTTSFKNFINGDFTIKNSGHLALFLLFISQLFFRPIISYLLLKTTNHKRIRIIDIGITLLMVGVTYFELNR